MRLARLTATVALISATTLARALTPAWPETPDPASTACSTSQTAEVARLLDKVESRASNAPPAIAASTCKPWLGTEQGELLAVAFDDETAGRVRILVAVKARGAWLAWHLRDIEVDASIDPGQLRMRLDTARYALAPGGRAFGLDIDRGYFPHCSDTSPGPDRSLYLLRGKQLAIVLEDLMLSSTTIVAGDRGRCGSSQDPEAGKPTVLEQMRTTLEVAAATHHGLRDLLVTETYVRDDAQPASSRRRYRLRYDGQLYRRD